MEDEKKLFTPDLKIIDNDRMQLARALKQYHDTFFTPGVYEHSIFGKAALFLEADAMLKEKYIDLADAFVDYVCSGIPNLAPYCKNKTPGCVDGREWCLYNQSCRGFTPVEREE